MAGHKRVQQLLTLVLAVVCVRAKDQPCKDPATVRNLTAVVDGSTHFVLSWEAPETLTPMCIGGYMVCVGGSQDEVCSSTGQTQWSDLGSQLHTLPCTEYRATVATLDQNRHPVINTSISFRTGPGSPANFSSVRKSKSRELLTWSVPSPTSCARFYQLSYCSTSSYWQQHCEHTALSLPIGYTEYSLWVEPCKYNHIAMITVGDGSNSSAKTLIVSPLVENPESPTKLSVEVLGSTGFMLSWEDPEGASTECRVGYRICFSPAGTEDGYECAFEKHRDTYPDTKSTWVNSHSPTAACTNYTASVASVYYSLDLDGRASDATAVTFHTGPENVANLTYHTNQTAIRVTWGQSRSASTCADHYSVSWCNVPYPWYEPCSLDTRNLTTNETSFEITGLTACSYYWLSVSTEGKDGTRSETKQLIVTPPVDDEVRNLDLAYEYGSNFAAEWDIVGGDACIRGYRVCWRGVDAEEECDTSRLNNYESRYNLSLEMCSNYTLDVAALDVYNGTSKNITASFSTGPANVKSMAVTHVSTRSALVTWEPSPSNCTEHYILGACSTDYPDEPCNPINTTSLNSTIREYNITTLEPCTYTIISIRTSTADGRPSASREKIVKTKLEEFGPFTHISLTAFSARLFILEYRAPSNVAQCMAGYIGCFKEAGSSGEPMCSRTSNLQAWDNYDHATKACTKYDVKLTALSDDNRTWNTTMSFTSPPDEVKNLKVTNSQAGPSGSSVLVTWAVSPDNKCMTHQHINCSRVEMMSGNSHGWTVLWSTAANLTNNVTQYEINDLEPCMQHIINVFQEPTPLDPIPTEILFQTASNVTSVKHLEATSSGERSLNVTYIAAEASPRCVSKHAVCWRREPAGNVTCRRLKGSGETRLSIVGLEPCTRYQVSVTPVAPNGDSYMETVVTTTTAGCQNGASVTFKASLTINTGLFLWVLLFQ